MGTNNRGQRKQKLGEGSLKMMDEAGGGGGSDVVVVVPCQKCVSKFCAKTCKQTKSDAMLCRSTGG